MSPFERKVVHDAIAEIDGVVTESTGEGKNRHVVLLPDDDYTDNDAEENDN
jgi:single-stranded nucleic acid binding R3H domain protein